MPPGTKEIEIGTFTIDRNHRIAFEEKTIDVTVAIKRNFDCFTRLFISCTIGPWMNPQDL